MIGWNFPSNGGGAINGVADSGVEIFRGKEIPSLAREICQNSLDAAIDEKSAVTVEFQRYNITPKDIPDVQSFKRVLEACLAFWTGKSEKTVAFIRQAIYKLKGSAVSSVLRISDFNTTGLAEPFNYRAMTGWNTLTKINGGAIKSDDKAGNFGIGKNAPRRQWLSWYLSTSTLGVSRQVLATTARRKGICLFQISPRWTKFISESKGAPTFLFTASMAAKLGKRN